VHLTLIVEFVYFTYLIVAGPQHHHHMIASLPAVMLATSVIGSRSTVELVIARSASDKLNTSYNVL